MSSRRMICGLFLAAGVAILVLLIMPAVHVPFIVVHGPVSALRAQRAAWLFQFLAEAAAFLLAGLLPLRSAQVAIQKCFPRRSLFVPMPSSFALRC